MAATFSVAATTWLNCSSGVPVSFICGTENSFHCTINSFEERVIFFLPFEVTDTETRHSPARLNDNTPLRNAHAPVARYARVPLIFDDTSFDAFNVAPTVSMR